MKLYKYFNNNNHGKSERNLCQNQKCSYSLLSFLKITKNLNQTYFLFPTHLQAIPGHECSEQYMNVF